MKESDINTESENLIKASNSDDTGLKQKASSDVEEVDQDNLKVELKDIKAEYGSVTKFLSLESVALEQKDIFDVVKFTIIVEAASSYKWEVYRRPFEIKKNFQNISEELTRNNIALTGNFNEMFNIVQTWNDDGIQLHLSEVENYYKNLFLNPQVYDTKSFKEFFNISLESFNQNNSGSKPFEGYVYKKADPHCLRKAFSLVCYCIEYFAFSQYNLRYLIVQDDKIYYKEKSDSPSGKNTYFFDKDSKVKKEGRDTINLTNSSLSLTLKFKTVFEREIWYNEINKRVELNLRILKENKYKAYTNQKKKNKAHWFADGEKYFADLAQKLTEAQSTIFITDWWMSPEVWLVRPVPINPYMVMAFQSKKRKESPPYSRLMDILYECANRGVKVYILLYAEMSLILTLNSSHTQASLTSLHPNIRVIRHPLNSLDLLWTHHEKLVIIDQIIGYVGGIDLCWGRFDTNEHPIVEKANPSDNPEYLFPGIDYSNARIRDFSKVSDYLKESASREKEARMPWHDVHCRIIGPAVADIARHFVERWNFSKSWTGEGITDVKTNSSVSKEIDKIKKAELNLEPEEKKEGFIMGILNKARGIINLESKFGNPFGEKWLEISQKIKQRSSYRNFPSHLIKSFIAKSDDDLRQESLAMQLIKIMQDIFNKSKVNLYLRTYEIIITSQTSGLIEFIPDALSIDSLKKKTGTDLYSFYRDFFLHHFKEAQKNFIESLAAYSLVTYILNLKDRHNGNIMIDIQGRIIHIDFGFILGISPGGVGFETAPFKMTKEYLYLMDGINSEAYKYFIDLLTKGFLEIRKYFDSFVKVVEILGKNSDMACFNGRDINRVLRDFIERFHLEKNDNEIKDFIETLTKNSINSWRTYQYDVYQQITNGIKP